MKFKHLLILINRIIFVSFFSLLIYYIIFEIKGLNPSILIMLVMISLFCVWLLLTAFIGQYVGAPNNIIYDNDIIFEKEMTIIEISSNVWKIENCDTELDMSGWLRQKYYIAKFMTAIICLNSYNKIKQSALSLPFGTQTANIEKITLIFLNRRGQKTTKTIVKKNKVKKGLSLRVRFWASLKSTPTSQTRYNDFKYYKIEIRDCFKIC